MTNPHLNKLSHVTGVANSQPITFEAGAYEFSIVRFVTLSHDYLRSPPPHYPDVSPGQKPGTSLTQSAQTIPSGTRLQLYSAEAAALVAAGAAAYS